ncbi:hypothetical protein TTHERM_00903860 (macronuclear) [Tetrahymena thermophila SB210]|uniref:Uncharacterized protein n=1 Tax=Tetrahymena thermophila (strain SB210) TaxID=312017 RepID=Q24GB1_TETTS|nr:hypothetical protein TTHERM_00903860 [Tetrahymena thermophila SB210]EAS06819.2 hypothetical protein TTHERM_00903860 [Tetrahymena thermophila SB210]|eukprot:XP_001027061.2 hypothetical protein TTHERM_00903860 [Tetrahymena thermophila SB210]
MYKISQILQSSIVDVVEKAAINESLSTELKIYQLEQNFEFTQMSTQNIQRLIHTMKENILELSQYSLQVVYKCKQKLISSKLLTKKINNYQRLPKGELGQSIELINLLQNPETVAIEHKQNISSFAKQ